MGFIRQLKEHIAVSLYTKPSDLDTLLKLDFLKFIAGFNVERMLVEMIRDGWVYKRGKKYYVYKSTAKKHLKEYDLI